MATAPQLDFEAYVARKKSEHGTAPDASAGPAYAYRLDHQTRRAFETVKPVELAINSTVRMWKDVWRNQLLGSAVRVSDRQFPRIQRVAETCADTLQIPTPQIYIVSNPTLNAATFGTSEESFIMVHSALVDHYTEEELLTVIGHECGHIHNSHVVYLTALHFLTRIAGAFTKWITQPAVMALLAWSRRAEITCDRAGMLCSKSDAASARALTKLALGSRKLHEEFNLDAFLEQYQEGKEGLGRHMEAFASHPYLPKRVLAMRVFAESELYRRALGDPSAGLSMTEVDDRVAALLKGDA